eukprot:4453763-Pyramimonas_sp.AAC.1
MGQDQESPNMAQVGPGTTHEGPKTTQEAPRIAQDGLKRAHQRDPMGEFSNRHFEAPAPRNPEDRQQAP